MANISGRRAQALQRLDILDTAPEDSYDAITRLAAAICDTPFAAVSFLDRDRQWFKSQVGLAIKETPLSESFCKHTVDQLGPLIVNDAQIDPRFMQNKLVIAGPKLRFYAGCALKAHDGTAVGAICVLDTEARPRGLSLTERSALEVLARQVEAQLELRIAMKERDVQLADSRRLIEELAFRGSHDALTSLPNRGLFSSRLQQGIEECDRSGASLSLILLDVDHFKQTNDSLGHDAGDALLCGFAASLQSVVRSADTVARIGGDEFAIVLTNVAPDGPDRSIVENLIERIGQPIKHRGRSIDCLASIGVSTYPKDADNGEALTKCSDLALAAAKRNRGTAVVFTPDMLDVFKTELRAVTNVRTCLATDDFDPFYQRKVDLTNGQRVGLEALLRWRHPDKVDFPNIFGPEFHDKSLVAKVGLRMIEKILDDLQRWTAAGVHVGRVAINSSAIDFARDDFAENLLAQLQARSISPALIELEITETVFLGRGVSYIARALQVLRTAGVSIALDDFGTGYASLTHLRQYPVDVLKIDQAFVGGITHSVDDAAIVRAVIGLAKNLEIVTIAEGIESAAQEAFVRHHGCNIGQGYLYGGAIPASEVRAEAIRPSDAA